MSDTALMTVHGQDGAPSLEAAAEELGVSIDDLDRAFGVILIDPGRRLYGVQVNADRLPPDRGSGPYRGPFSNPRIDTFGPIQTDPRKKKP
jgi:hypothetical protein